jgi:diadenosine tetraphosphate (Ap4A) HIT family hydrolase
VIDALEGGARARGLERRAEAAEDVVDGQVCAQRREIRVVVDQHAQLRRSALQRPARNHPHLAVTRIGEQQVQQMAADQAGGAGDERGLGHDVFLRWRRDNTMRMDFELHDRLAADTFFVVDWPLCRLLLMNDARFPWCILVPRRAGVREIYELGTADRTRLLEESCTLGRALMQAFEGDKLNVAALGNVVPQLHLHHVVRHVGDATWPAPVWGTPARAYAEAERAERLAMLKTALARA